MAFSFTPTTTTGSTTPGQKAIIPYSILTGENDIQQEWTPTGSTTTVICLVDGQYADHFLEDMLGYSSKVGTTLNRVLPERCQYVSNNFTSFAGQYALSGNLVKNFGGFTTDPVVRRGWPVFAAQHYRITFGTPLYKVLENGTYTYEHERFVVWTPRGVAENEKIPGGGFKFTTDAGATYTRLSEVGVMTGRTVELEAKWLDVPYVNFTKISLMANRVNTSAVTFNGVTYAAQTVLFKTWSAPPKVNALGLPTQDITFAFSIKMDYNADNTTHRSWNKFWVKQPSSAGVSYVDVVDDAGNPPYATADLNLLFSFA
jgi:hypothetical protein